MIVWVVRTDSLNPMPITEPPLTHVESHAHTHTPHHILCRHPHHTSHAHTDTHRTPPHTHTRCIHHVRTCAHTSAASWKSLTHVFLRGRSDRVSRHLMFKRWRLQTFVFTYRCFPSESPCLTPNGCILGQGRRRGLSRSLSRGGASQEGRAAACTGQRCERTSGHRLTPAVLCLHRYSLNAHHTLGVQNKRRQSLCPQGALGTMGTQMPQLSRRRSSRVTVRPCCPSTGPAESGLSSPPASGSRGSARAPCQGCTSPLPGAPGPTRQAPQASGGKGHSRVPGASFPRPGMQQVAAAEACHAGKRTGRSWKGGSAHRVEGGLQESTLTLPAMRQAEKVLLVGVDLGSGCAQGQGCFREISGGGRASSLVSPGDKGRVLCAHVTEVLCFWRGRKEGVITCVALSLSLGNQ